MAGGGARRDSECLTFVEETEAEIARYRLTVHTFVFNLKPVPNNVTIVEWVERGFREMYEHLLDAAERNPENRIILSFKSANMNTEAYCNLTRIADFPFDRLWEIVASVSQSAGGFDGNEGFSLKLRVVRPPPPVAGRCGTAQMERAPSTFKIVNPNDIMCLPRSIVLALEYQKYLKKQIRTKADKTAWRKICDLRRQEQLTKAIDLSLSANIVVPAAGCGRVEIERFQEYLTRKEKAAIVIYSYERGKKPTIYYDGREYMRQQNIKNKYTLYIVYYVREKHYEPIKLLHQFLCYKYYCEPCEVGYQRIENHLKCPHHCPRCLRSPRCREQERIICQNCHHTFLSADCYDHHLLQNSFSAQYSVCQSLVWCPNCQISLTRNVTHQCGMSYCRTCDKVKDNEHKCSITPQPKKPGKSKKVAAFLYYDFEARQDVEVLDGEKLLKIHIPNYYVAHLICQRCATLPDDDICEPATRSPTARSPCNFCVIREFKYHGDDAVKNFVDLTLTFKKCYSTVVCIAHNAKGYDAQFLIREFLHRKKDSITSLIITGTNINLMECSNLKFIDSLNYMQMALASLPKAFGLGDINKGYFPHFFNTIENQNYVGPMPPKETFGIRASSLKDQKVFDDWYQQKVDERYIFDFKKEMEYYCTMDVVILRRAATIFQLMIIKVGNVCPFTECVTIASTCLLIFRRNFLKEGDIAILHRNGYRLADNQSRTAIEWLLWLEHSQNIKIKHAGRSREYVLNKLKLDGYREENGVKYAYQFHGCYWHGCKRCFKTKRNVRSKDGTTFDSRLINTERLSEQIRILGFQLVEIWECEFNAKRKSNVQMQNYISSIDAQFFIPLDPRDAFFGGRTGNTVTHYDVKDGEQIHYDDFCSLYPYVLKTKPYPLGHPELYLWDQIGQICPNNDITNVDGLIKFTTAGSVSCCFTRACTRKTVLSFM